jgi:peptidoglycan-N-acetylglucosamine deacetylase
MIPFAATHVPRAFCGLFPDLLWRVRTDEKIAYLTFDDGPTSMLTQELLDLLERFQARATFFLLGDHAQRHKDLVRQIHAAGHTIGNHTFTHPDAWLSPASRVMAELDQTTLILEDVIQTPIRLMRPPYGRFTRSMRSWCQTRRQQLTMWDVMPGDYLPGATAAGLQRHMLNCVRTGSIIVLHDNPKARLAMPAALEQVLLTLTAQGWRFLAL